MNLTRRRLIFFTLTGGLGFSGSLYAQFNPYGFWRRLVGGGGAAPSVGFNSAICVAPVGCIPVCSNGA